MTDALPTPAAEPPLCVDLDGTLVAGDTLHLSLALLARSRPWVLPWLPVVVCRGRAAFKRYVSDRTPLEPGALPYRAEVVQFLREERGAGRRILLATAADARIAVAVSEHLGLFDGIIASDGRHNAKGLGKVQAIREHLAGSEFDYMGDSLVDLPVFQAARRSYLVHPRAELVAAACRGGDCHVVRIFGPDS